ncbi:MAG: SGNH/GDSL hydrolase family protein [Planctomycetes bacterium]|nr:SGNH/GDSL hydrolase family protein [Planctomycetota bacterium]
MSSPAAARPRMLRNLLIILVVLCLVLAGMLYRQRRLIAAYLGYYAVPPPPQMNGHPSERGTLFIGNSLTFFNDLPATIQYLAEQVHEPQAFEYGQETSGGASLASHWYGGGALKRIKAGKWAHVVLQDYSTMPIDDPETMANFTREFDREIKAQGADTVLFMTWAWKDVPGAQDKVSKAYDQIGKDLGIPVVPVGRAWALAQKEKPTLNLYCDERHPNPAGTYLAACVFYGFLYHTKPTGLTTKVPWLEIPEEDAVFLQQMAAKALLDAGQLKE